MNGVRNFLRAATTSTTTSPSSANPESQSQPPFSNTSPLKSLSGPSWPPSSPTQAQTPTIEAQSPKTTPALFLKKDLSRHKPQPPPPPDDSGVGNSSFRSSTSTSSTTSMSTSASTSTSASASTSMLMMTPPRRSQTSSPPTNSRITALNGRNSSGSPSSSSSSPRTLPSNLIMRKSISHSESDWKRSSGTLNTRDELLISLLASQAVVDSRDFEILGSEEVDELKKEHQVLTSRLEAMSKKLILETKIRDAAISLTKVNASHKKVSKQSDEQLEAANRRVEAAQKELWRVSERTHDIHKKLLEHRAGVLSLSVRSMEKKIAGGGIGAAGEDSGYDSSNRSTLMSPTSSSMTGMSGSSRKARFDGAHLFAGHADAVTPRRRLLPEAAAAEITTLEEKLKAATESLTAAGKKQAEMSRELSLMKLEKEEVETMMGMDLQSAEDTISALEKELPRLEGLDAEVQQLEEEKSQWEEERAHLEERAQQVEVLQARLAEVEARSGGDSAELAELRESSRRMLEEKDAEIQRITTRWNADRETWGRAKAKAGEELDAGLAGLKTLVKQHGIVLFSRDSSLQGLLASVGTHLENVDGRMEGLAKAETGWEAVKRKLEEDVRNELDKREALARDLEQARHERDEARLECRASVKDSPILQTSSLSSSMNDSVAKVISILEPIWQILPSPEARAARFSSPSSRSFRTGSPLNSPGIGNNAPSSLSDLDVRALKAVYDATRTGAPGSPIMMPNVIPSGGFTVEAFAARVQALITDDRALIERLLRFAQAHDLLKKNAERAQKLAQEGNAALETYQKQVRTLEERNMSMAARHAALQDDVQELQDAVERITSEKQEVEMLAAEQAETCRQLTEANNTLSARTLTLAEEAASAPEAVRKQLEGQLMECRAALEMAQEEVNAMKTSEQSQKIALLDELNSMQTENGALRAQLRARK